MTEKSIRVAKTIEAKNLELKALETNKIKAKEIEVKEIEAKAIEEKVKKYIIKNDILKKGDKVITGLSGGADSVCLAEILYNLSAFFELELTAVHVHHGIRGAEADRDMEFVEEFCRERDINLKIFRHNVPEIAKKEHLTEEEAGRKVRYEDFENTNIELYDGQGKIAVAHNMNDNAETFLHNICRGSGIKGLTGIRAVNGKIVRPVLCLERREIENYLLIRRIKYINDSTNFEEEYTRNKIRLKVLPFLRENINNKCENHINDITGEMQEIEKYLEDQTDKIYNENFWEEPGKITVDKKVFNNLDIVIRKRLIRRAVLKLAERLKDVTRQNVEDVVELALNQSGREVSLPYGITVKNTQQNITFLMKNITSEKIDYGLSDFEMKTEILELNDENNQNRVAEIIKNKQNMYTKCFDYDKISSNVCLRTRLSGDYLMVKSRGNEKLSKKKLKEYFINEKIPADKRNSLPLVADGQHILWICGHRISEFYKVSENTKRVMVITVRRIEN